ncbi:MAG: preprotein translocase subunit SecE [Candidatus Makana argininalis]
MILNKKKINIKKKKVYKYITILSLLFFEPFLNIFFKKNLNLNIKIIKFFFIILAYFISITTYKFKSMMLVLNKYILEINNSVWPSFKETLIITLIIIFLTIIISFFIFLLDNIILNILYFILI